MKPFEEDLKQARIEKLVELLSLPLDELCKQAGIEYKPFVPTGIWIRPK